MKYFAPLILFTAGWLLLLLSNSFTSISLINGSLQLLLFVLVVCVKATEDRREMTRLEAWRGIAKLPAVRKRY